MTERQRTLLDKYPKLGEEDKNYIESLSAKLAVLDDERPAKTILKNMEKFDKRHKTLGNEPDNPVNETQYPYIQKLPWWETTVTIKGKNQGVKEILVEFPDSSEKAENIVDFLNNSLATESFELQDDVIIAYEEKLDIDSLFEYDYPGLPKELTPIVSLVYEYTHYPDDKTLVEALLAEYKEKLKTIPTIMAEWQESMETWYNAVKDNPDQAKLPGFRA